MILNGQALLRAAPMSPMVASKQVSHGVSHGLSVAGYDLRIRQAVSFEPDEGGMMIAVSSPERRYPRYSRGRFTIASTMEAFHVPTNLVGMVKDKSTWARKGLSVFNTVVEPGWIGDALTLELVYHGNDGLHIPAGAGIAQIVFEEIAEPAQYEGKYQYQAARPVAAIMEKG